MSENYWQAPIETLQNRLNVMQAAALLLLTGQYLYFFIFLQWGYKEMC
jgi:hypothetical protein